MDYNDLARNSEDTLTSPICFFINFDIGCVPQALKEAVFVLCQHLLCWKPREEMKVRLEQKRQVLKQHWRFQSFSPWFLAPSFLSRPITTPFFIRADFWMKSQDLEIAFHSENKILLIGTHFLLLFRKHYSSPPHRSQCRHLYLYEASRLSFLCLHLYVLQGPTQFRPCLCTGGSQPWVQIWAPLLPSCETLGKLLNLSEPTVKT